jgi:cytochrome c oxidase subunit 1
MANEIRSAGRKGLALLPLQWFAGMAVVWLGTFWAGRGVVLGDPGSDVESTYFIVGRFGVPIPLYAAFALFGLAYAAAKPLRLSYDGRLAQIHFWTFFAGAILILLPGLTIGVTGRPTDPTDYPHSFAISNAYATAGYAVAGLATLLFAAMAIRALIRRRQD